MSNTEVWEVIKEAMTYLDDDYLIKITTAAKKEALKGNKIFMPLVGTEFADPFATSIKDTTKED